MGAFILAYFALRRPAEEKRIPEPQFQPFRLEFLRPVKENGDEPLSLALDQSGETAIV